jgi:hypothetical protein
MKTFIRRANHLLASAADLYLDMALSALRLLPGRRGSLVAAAKPAGEDSTQRLSPALA